MNTTNANSFFSRALLALVLAVSFLGVTSPAWSDHDRLRNEIRQFHVFLQEHPKVSTELQSNPNLVNNKKYLDKHDDLETFMKRHPDVRREIVHHPGRVFGRYYRDDHARWRHR
jgi:hypothetical protein